MFDMCDVSLDIAKLSKVIPLTSIVSLIVCSLVKDRPLIRSSCNSESTNEMLYLLYLLHKTSYIKKEKRKLWNILVRFFSLLFVVPSEIRYFYVS